MTLGLPIRSPSTPSNSVTVGPCSSRPLRRTLATRSRALCCDIATLNSGIMGDHSPLRYRTLVLVQRLPVEAPWCGPAVGDATPCRTRPVGRNEVAGVGRNRLAVMDVDDVLQYAGG